MKKLLTLVIIAFLFTGVKAQYPDSASGTFTRSIGGGKLLYYED